MEFTVIKVIFMFVVVQVVYSHERRREKVAKKKAGNQQSWRSNYRKCLKIVEKYFCNLNQWYCNGWRYHSKSWHRQSESQRVQSFIYVLDRLLLLKMDRNKIMTIRQTSVVGGKLYDINMKRKIVQFSLVYNQIIDPCGTYIHSQVNTGINIGIIYN